MSYPKLTARPAIDVAGVVVSTEPNRHVSGAPHPKFTLVLPFWLIMLALSVAPCLAYLRRRRNRRLKASNLCRACGYDLTGNVSGVCPECGVNAQ